MVRIRATTDEDVEILSDLYAQLGYPLASTELTTRICSIRNRPDHILLVAVGPSDQPRGLLHACEQIGPDLVRRCAVVALVVDRDHRDRGIGTCLLRAAEVWAGDRDLEALVVRSAADRRLAHAFYERRGFCDQKLSRRFSRALRPSACGTGPR